jgi:hypothetical protein
LLEITAALTAHADGNIELSTYFGHLPLNGGEVRAYYEEEIDPGTLRRHLPALVDDGVDLALERRGVAEQRLLIGSGEPLDSTASCSIRLLPSEVAEASMKEDSQA